MDEGGSDTLSLQNLDMQAPHPPPPSESLLPNIVQVNPIDKLYLMQNSYFSTEQWINEDRNKMNCFMSWITHITENTIKWNTYLELLDKTFEGWNSNKQYLRTQPPHHTRHNDSPLQTSGNALKVDYCSPLWQSYKTHKYTLLAKSRVFKVKAGCKTSKVNGFKKG